MANNKEHQITDENEAKIDIHRAIVLWLFFATSTCCFLLAVPLLYSYFTRIELFTIMPVVILAGVLGSFVSALKRIYSAKNIFPIGNYYRLFKGTNVYLIAYSSIPPLVGAISAAILYVIFASKIITGPFFPEFSCESEQNCNEFITFFSYWSPDGPTDYSKAIAWGFIAGFSEKFVPDILNKIVTDSNSKPQNK